MGEIADMMIEGILDCETGEYIGDENIDIYGTESPGFPTSRANNRKIMKEYEEACYGFELNIKLNLKSRDVKVHCPICERKVKAVGMKDHIRACHSDAVLGQ